MPKIAIIGASYLQLPLVRKANACEKGNAVKQSKVKFYE